MSKQEGTTANLRHIAVAALPEEAPHPHEECRALGAVLSLIGDKWTIMVVGCLERGPRRFNEMRRMIGGISQRMLTLTLRRLEEEGIVARHAFATIPPRVDYELTAHGHTLIEPLRALGSWAEGHRAQRQAALAENSAQAGVSSVGSPSR